MFHAKAMAGAIIEIYSVDGRRVFQQPVVKDANQTTVYIPVLPAGTYNLLFVNENKVAVKKIVKQ